MRTRLCRPIAKIVLSEAERETLEDQPSRAMHWPSRSMAAELGMSQSAVSRIWPAFGLKPNLVEQFRLSPDPQCIDELRNSRPRT